MVFFCLDSRLASPTRLFILQLRCLNRIDFKNRLHQINCDFKVTLRQVPTWASQMQKEDKSNEIRSCADLNTVEDNLKDRIKILYQVLHLSVISYHHTMYYTGMLIP